ncbi:MAG: hypothetical protein E6I33_10870 [Chloroflexi bacterium]|nr:MAG: hypothetical protein E6I33_10870 [Chloroflexota bacterium]
MRLRIEYVWDDEGGGWGFRVPALHIVGGVNGTRLEAERAAIDAINFTLEGVERDFDDDGTEVEFLEVDVQPPARAAAS